MKNSEQSAKDIISHLDSTEKKSFFDYVALHYPKLIPILRTLAKDERASLSTMQLSEFGYHELTESVLDQHPDFRTIMDNDQNVSQLKQLFGCNIAIPKYIYLHTLYQQFKSAK